MIPIPAPIALAEDDEDDVFFMNRAFKAAGIGNPLILLRNGKQVIEYLSAEGPFADRDKHPLPTLLLLDLKLPVKNGLQILEWVRAHPLHRNLVIVMLSTSGESRDVAQAYALGANGYLVKPTGSEALAAQMRALKHYWLEQNVFPEPSSPGSQVPLRA